MTIAYKDFIGFYSNVFPEGYCAHLISEFERFAQNGVGSDRQKAEGTLRHIKDDHQIFINMRNHNMVPFNDTSPADIFFDGLQKCYDAYSEQYSILKDSGNIRATVMKMQRTTPGGGYHIWHGEQGPGVNAGRVVVYMLYLNTLEENQNGETEFIYQEAKIRPQENVMILWPAAYTHAHRGNPVYNNGAKYIVTGWFYYD